MIILLISPYFSPAVGGVETHLIDLCNFLASKKHYVYVRTYKALGTKDRGTTNENSQYIHVHRLWWPDFNLNYRLENIPPLRFIYLFTGLFFDSFFFLLKNRRQIDVIQTHGFVAAVIGGVLKKLFSIRSVVNTHVGFNFSDSSNLITKVISKTLLTSDAVLVLVTSAKKELLKIGLGADKIVEYHYWVDQNVFTLPNIKKIPKTFTVLFVGRLVPQKGLDTLIDLVQKFPEIIFQVAGTGPSDSIIKAAIASYSNLIFLGRINNTDLVKYYHSSSILLVPSHNLPQTYEEGIPRVIIEALFSGLPVLATITGGIPDVIVTPAAILVPDDISSISRQLSRLRTHPGLLKTMSKSARAFALSKFGLANAKIIESSLIGP